MNLEGKKKWQNQIGSAERKLKNKVKKKKKSRPFPLWCSEDYRTCRGNKPRMPRYRKAK